MQDYTSNAGYGRREAGRANCREQPLDHLRASVVARLCEFATRLYYGLGQSRGLKMQLYNLCSG